MTKPKKDQVPVEPEASDANAAARAEAATTATSEPGEAVTVEYGGRTYTLDTDGDGWPLEASLAFARLLNMEVTLIGDLKSVADIGTFLESLLGPTQWAAFSKGARTADLRGLHSAVMARIFGVSVGEASAS